jgi:hypothetical protein
VSASCPAATSTFLSSGDDTVNRSRFGGPKDRAWRERITWIATGHALRKSLISCDEAR